MFVKRLLHSKYSNVVIAIILGFGLSTLFRRACKKRDCIIFKAHDSEKINGKIFKHNDKCFEYKTTSITCDDNRSDVEIE